jgi:hypothetical protein
MMSHHWLNVDIRRMLSAAPGRRPLLYIEKKKKKMHSPSESHRAIPEPSRNRPFPAFKGQLASNWLSTIIAPRLRRGWHSTNAMGPLAAVGLKQPMTFPVRRAHG